MDVNKDSTPHFAFLERFRKSWFPPAAIVGAFSAFVAAAFRVRPSPKAAPQPARFPAPAGLVQLSFQSSHPRSSFEREYTMSGVLGSASSAQPFRNSLRGIAVGPGDKVYALGDDEVRIFSPDGNVVRNWKEPGNAACLAVGPDERVCLGVADRIEIHDVGGARVGGFAAGDEGRPATITAIKIFRREFLVADAAARFIRRYDLNGKKLGEIGTQNKTGCFMLPNRWLDFDVDSSGVVRATDTGRHQVTMWALDGSPLGAFGKFGMSDPRDFVGCCNPVNLALTPDGKIVTAEKMIARVKVYEPDGRLLAVIGPEHFDPNCTHIHLAVDSQGRILAADPVRREIRIFSMTTKRAVESLFCGELERA